LPTIVLTHTSYTFRTWIMRLSLMTFEELARRRRNDSLGATHEYTCGCRHAPIRSCPLSRGGCAIPLNSHHDTMTELEISNLWDNTVPFSVQFTLALTAYFMLSMPFPAHETMPDQAILEQETLPDHGKIPAATKRLLIRRASRRHRRFR